MYIYHYNNLVYKINYSLLYSYILLLSESHRVFVKYFTLLTRCCYEFPIFRVNLLLLYRPLFRVHFNLWGILFPTSSQQIILHVAVLMMTLLPLCFGSQPFIGFHNFSRPSSKSFANVHLLAAKRPPFRPLPEWRYSHFVTSATDLGQELVLSLNHYIMILNSPYIGDCH